MIITGAGGGGGIRRLVVVRHTAPVVPALSGAPRSRRGVVPTSLRGPGIARQRRRAIGGPGGAARAPSRAVVGGLVFATVATLMFVPVVFSMLHRRQDTRDDRRQSQEPALARGEDQVGTHVTA